MKKTIATDKFKFLTEKSIRRDKFELTQWQSASLRKQLPRGLYWVQMNGSRIISWNWDLTWDYLQNGDCSSHQRLVEEYVSTLPKAG